MKLRWQSERGITAFSLIEILVVMAIIVYMATIMIPRYGIGAKTPQEKAKTPIGKAKGVECTSYLSQIRSAITMYSTSSGTEKPPATLQELKSQGVADQQMYCPEGGKQYPYGYDPRTGRVWCPYPGHEKL